MIRVGWLFSMARSGTSIACYGAASPWGHPVCDEPFGPWDRTQAPFNHPAVQRQLMEAFQNADHRLTEDVCTMLHQLLGTMGARTGSVICKVPHLNPRLEELEAWRPGSRRVLLLRNPLHRLNSLYARGWEAASADDYDVERYRIFARRWLDELPENRLVYDDIRDDPQGFFRKMYDALGWLYEDADLLRATAYCRSHYHHRSKRVDRQADPSRPISTSRPGLPTAAIEAYLADPAIVGVMRTVGWSVRPEDYAMLAERKDHAPPGVSCMKITRRASQ